MSEYVPEEPAVGTSSSWEEVYKTQTAAIETLRARVLEMEARNAGLVEAIEDAAERIRNRRSKAEAAEARVAELENTPDVLKWSKLRRELKAAEATIARIEGLLETRQIGDLLIPASRIRAALDKAAE